MRVLRWVKVKEINLIKPVLNKSVLNLVDHLKNGGSVPPIHIRINGNGKMIIKDGRHRVTAFRLLEKEDIHARIMWGER